MDGENAHDQIHEGIFKDFSLTVLLFFFLLQVNLMTGVSHPSHVNAMLKRVLVRNNGWKASDYPIRQPRSGWYAQRANAEFSFKAIASLETNYLL